MDANFTVNEHSTILELYNNHRLSIRAYHCCYAENIKTVEELISYYHNHRGVFKWMRQCGRKTEEELLFIVEQVLGTRLTFDQQEYDYVNFLSGLWHEYLKRSLPCLSSTLKELAELPTFNKNTLSTLFDTLLEIPSPFEPNTDVEDKIRLYGELQMVIIDSKSYSGTGGDELKNKIEKYSISIEHKRMDDIKATFEDLPSSLQRLCRTAFSKKLEVLPKRAKSFIIETYGDYISFINSVPETADDIAMLLPGATMRTTAKQIIEFKESLEKTLSPLFSKDEEAALKKYLEIEYSEFSNDLQDRLVAFWKETRQLPMVSIVSQLLLCDKTVPRIFYEYYMNPENRRELSAVANVLHISRERVRQVIFGGEKSEEKIKTHIARALSCKDWDMYSSLIEKDIIFEDDCDYLELSQQEGLSDNFVGYFTMLGFYSNHKIHYILDHPVAVMDSYWKRLKLDKFIDAIIQERERPHYKTSKFMISHFSSEITSEDLNNNDELSGAINKIVTKLLELPTDETGLIVFPRNTISYEDEVVKILETNGEPMTYQEIYDSLASQLKNDLDIKLDTLKHKIVNCDRLTTVGLTGTVVMKDWTHVFTGNIRELVEQILNQSTCPISSKDLVDLVRLEFPNTNERSLLNSLKNDIQNRFVTFKGEFIGLANHDYGPNFSIKESVPRKSFDENLADFLNFIDKNHRFPFASDSAEGGILFRWHDRIKKGIISSTEQERDKLEKSLAIYNTPDYPKNSFAYRFMKNCEEIKDLVRTERRKLNTKDRLFFWLYKYNRTKENLPPDIAYWFYDLERYLKTYGISI